MWDLLIGETKIGRLSDPRDDAGTTRCTFTPAPAFDHFARAFAAGDIWEGNDDMLDAVIDEIAVDGVFLVDDTGNEIIDPDLRIDGTSAWFQSRSST